jgi:hypothetical protein
MALNERDREDLISEATALVDRAAFAPAGAQDEVVIGFRGDGAASVYLTPDRVYHFTTAGELRRAYVDGMLYKAEHGRLVSMRRERTPHETSLMRRDLADREAEALLMSMRQELRELAVLLRDGKLVCSRQVTSIETSASAQTAESRAANWLSTLPNELAIARSAGLKRN